MGVPRSEGDEGYEGKRRGTKCHKKGTWITCRKTQTVMKMALLIVTPVRGCNSVVQHLFNMRGGLQWTLSTPQKQSNYQNASVTKPGEQIGKIKEVSHCTRVCLFRYRENQETCSLWMNTKHSSSPGGQATCCLAL